MPVGIAAIVLTEAKLANVKATDPQPIDWPGLATFSGGLFLLIFGLIRGNPEGWGSAPIVLSLGAAVLLLVAFLVIEARRENAMLDLSLFRKPSFTGVSIVAFALSAGMFAMFLYLTLYIQGVLGYSPLEAGLRFLPLTVLSFIVAPISGRLLNRVPARAIMGTGLMLVALGLLLMHGIDVGDDWTTHPRGRRWSPGSASGWPTRASPRSRSGSSTPPGPGWPRGSTAPSARSGSRPAPRRWARSSSRRSARSWASCCRRRRRRSPRRSPPAPRRARSHRCRAQFREQAADAANTAFISALNEILLVGAAIALVGGIAGWLLVRGRDMVALPGAQAPGPGEPGEPEPAPARLGGANPSAPGAKTGGCCSSCGSRTCC